MAKPKEPPKVPQLWPCQIAHEPAGILHRGPHFVGSERLLIRLGLSPGPNLFKVRPEQALNQWVPLYSDPRITKDCREINRRTTEAQRRDTETLRGGRSAVSDEEVCKLAPQS